MIVAPGATSVSVDVQWLDDTGAIVTGKVAADFPVVKWSGGSNTADTTITLSDLAAITTAHPNDNTAGGVKEREGGWYRLDLPNNMFTAAGSKKLTFAETTNKHFVVENIEVRYVQSDVQTIKSQTVTCAAGVTVSAFVGSTGAAINGTNVNTLSSHDPGATLGTSTLTQAQVSGGAYALNSSSFSFNAALDFTTAQKAATIARVTLVDTSTALTNSPTVGDLTATMKTSVQVAADAAVTANALINAIAGYVDTEVGAIKAKTDQLTFTVGGQVDANVITKTGFKLASDGIDAVAITAPAGVASNFREMVVQVWRRFFKKSTLTSSQLKTYADDGSTVLTTQTVSDDSTTQTQGPSA